MLFRIDSEPEPVEAVSVSLLIGLGHLVQVLAESLVVEEFLDAVVENILLEDVVSVQLLKLLLGDAYCLQEDLRVGVSEDLIERGLAVDADEEEFE